MTLSFEADLGKEQFFKKKLVSPVMVLNGREKKKLMFSGSLLDI